MPLSERIPAAAAATSLKTYLRSRYPAGVIGRLLRIHAVRVNGRRARAETAVRGGDTITIFARAEDLERRPRFDLAAMIIHENERLAVLNKPSGLAVHGGPSIQAGRSLLESLQAHFQPQGITPWLVHRLDLETSGCLVVAKERETARELEALFKKGAVRKQYLALVVGVLPPGERRVDLELPGRAGEPVPAVSRFRTRQAYPGAEVTLLEAVIETGRMHQIRRHLARTLHPVVMDERYGDFAFNREFRRRFGLRRLFLHAERIAFTLAGRPVAAAAPLPADLQEVLDRLNAGSTPASMG